MESVKGVKIGIIVTKNSVSQNTGKGTNENQRKEVEGNIRFINLEEHKKFVKNIFSVFERTN